MSEIPALVEIDSFPGADFVEKLSPYLDEIYARYLNGVAHGGLTFRGLPVRCQFRPETEGRHFAFWHMMQEGSRAEEERVIDLPRCCRVDWISWVIQNADSDPRIRVFSQIREGKPTWVLWLFDSEYTVILHPRNNYYLLKTAFPVKSHKGKEFLRDWKIHAP